MGMRRRPCEKQIKKASRQIPDTLSPLPITLPKASKLQTRKTNYPSTSSPLYCCKPKRVTRIRDFESFCFLQSRSSAEMSGRLAISASARGMAEDSSSSRQMKKTTKTYVMKTDSQGNVTTHTDVQVSGSGSSESG